MPQSWDAEQVKAFVLAMMGEADKRYEQRFRAQQDALQKADDAQQRQAQAVARIGAAVMAVVGILLAGVLTVVGRMLVK